jgi:gliding motility-associated-like protein
LAGNNPALTGSGVGHWSQISGPNNATLVTPDNYICNVKKTKVGTYKFRWTISGGNECPDNYDDINVVIPDSSVTTANAGPDRTVCSNSPVYLQGNAIRADEISGWTVMPNNGVVFSPDNASLHPMVAGLLPSTTYTFVYAITNSCGVSSTDSVHITTTAATGPSTAEAGSNQCLPDGTNTILLKATPPVSGKGLWSQVSGHPCSIVNPASPQTTVNGVENGDYQFAWTVSANGCANANADTVIATVSKTTSQANAGQDINLCANIVQLNANAPASGIGAWTQISGDGAARITSPSQPATTVTNLSTGQYIFRWTVSNGVCPSTTDDVLLKISSPPSKANAGNDLTFCNNVPGSVNLSGVRPTSGKGQWVQVSGPIELHITNDTLPSSGVYGYISGNYVLRWVVTGGPSCPVSSDEMNLNIVYAANAGADQYLCNASVTSVEGNLGSRGTWTQIAGPSAVIFQNIPGNRNANISGLQPGSVYTFRYTLDAVYGCSSNYDDITIYDGTTPTPFAGMDTSMCNASAVQLKGNAPKANETGVWSIVSGPAGASFANANAPNTILNGITNGTYILKWTLSNGVCSTSDVKRIENFGSPTAANAGADKTICSGISLLQGNAPAIGIGTWTQISGPAASIDAVNNPSSAVSGLNTPGAYQFAWTVSNGSGCAVKSDTVTYRVPSFANAGQDQSLCDQSSAVLSANKPAAGAGMWKQVAGLPAVIANPASETTEVRNLRAGIYQFSWNISNPDGSCNTSDTVTVINSIRANKADAGTDDTICGATTISLTGNAPVTGANGSWTFISGPSAPVFVSRSTAQTRVSGLQPGTYKFEWSIASACASSSDEVSITILPNADIAKAGNDQRVCAASTVLHANAPTGVNKGIWSQAAGPNIAATTALDQPDLTLNNLVPGTYRFAWKIYNGKCYHTDTADVKIYPAASLNAGNDFSLCSMSGSIPLSAAVIGGAASTGSWSIVSGGGSLSSTASTRFPQQITYSPNGYSGPVTIRLTASDMCRVLSDDIVLNVKPSFRAFEAMDDYIHTDPDEPVGIAVLDNDNIPRKNALTPCDDNPVIVQPSHGIADANNDGTFTYTPTTGFAGVDSFQYKVCNVEVTGSSDSCSLEGKDRAWVYISVEGCVLPNAFSPNGDGVNDVFEIPCAQGDVDFQVFNRWGIEVYRNDHYANDWNGTYNNAPLPDGTYFYVVKYLSEKNYLEEKEGFITLHR